MGFLHTDTLSLLQYGTAWLWASGYFQLQTQSFTPQYPHKTIKGCFMDVAVKDRTGKHPAKLIAGAHG